MSSILSKAVKWKFLTSNPCDNVDFKTMKKYRPKFYNNEEVTAMVKALSGEPFSKKCMIYLAMDSAIRESELAGLTWSDIDFTTRKLEIDKQRQYISGYGELVRDPKSDNGVRTITLSVTVNNMLRDLQAQQQGEFEVVGETWNTDTHIFTHENGNRIHPAYPYRWFTAFLERHGLPKITFHQIRHTNISLSLGAGVDLVTASARSGHDKNVMLRTYSHVIPSKEEQAGSVMEEYYTANIDTDETPKIKKVV
ncbi:MAG: site-specific integrase [Oscillospiraceae bacterium]|nr:site-specific integrase [Oscillospiraceae bacterium]